MRIPPEVIGCTFRRAICRVSKYSPDGRMLAIEGDTWLQVLSLYPKAKTILFKEELNLGSAVQPVWIDNNRIVIVDERLLIVDIAKRTVKPWIKYSEITSMFYSKPHGRLYVYMKPSENEQQAIYAIDPATSHMERVSTGNLAGNFNYIYGVTADGKYAVVSGTDPSLPSTRTPKFGTTGIWTLDLDTGKHTLIAEGAAAAAILQSPKSKGK